MLNSAIEKKITSLQAKAFVVGLGSLVITLAALFFTPVVPEANHVYDVTTGLGARLFQALHIAWILLLGLPLGGLAIVMLRPLAGGAWSVVLQRVCEAASRTLWVFFFAGLFIMGLGSSYIFPWVHEEILHHNHIIASKVHYLNLGFFWLRYVLYFLIWGGLVWVFNNASKRLDETGNQIFAVRMHRFSAPGLVLFFLSVTFAMTDWVMSLEPEWFSTIFGPFWVVSFVLLTLSFMVIVLTHLDKWEPLKSRILPKHYHDIGNLMLGFVILWSYMSFSQFLITWSANLPEEIGWYLHRKGGGLTIVTVILMLFHFLVPMLYLLFRRNKKNNANLRKIAYWIIGMRIVDIYWNLAPSFAWNHSHIDFLSALFYLTAALGFGGLWLYLYLRELKRRPLLPVHDPVAEMLLPVTEEAASHA